MRELTKPEREKAAAALEELLVQVSAGDLAATARQRALLTGVILGLRGECHAATLH